MNIKSKFNLTSSLHSTVTSVDDYNSQASSSFTKISRKSHQQSTLYRRSHSKKSNQGSIERENLRGFYIRPGTTPVLIDHTVSENIQNHTSKQHHKKERQPTPSKSKNQLYPKSTRKQSIENQINLEKELLLVELEKKYLSEKKNNQQLQKNQKMYQGELHKINQKLREVENNLKESLERESLLNVKIKELENISFQKEENLNQAKNTLQKMKRQFKQYRIKQLELNNDKLISQNVELQKNNKEIYKQIQTLKLSCKLIFDELQEEKIKNSSSFLVRAKQMKEKEIQNLRVALQRSKNQRQQLLQKIIVKKQEDFYLLKMQNEKLQISMNYMNRKKTEEFEKIRQKKDEEMSSIRSKLALVHCKYNELTRQYGKLKRKNALFTCIEKERSNNHLYVNKNSRGESEKIEEDDCQFELSPQTNTERDKSGRWTM